METLSPEMHHPQEIGPVTLEHVSSTYAELCRSNGVTNTETLVAEFVVEGAIARPITRTLPPITATALSLELERTASELLGAFEDSMAPYSEAKQQLRLTLYRENSQFLPSIIIQP